MQILWIGVPKKNRIDNKSFDKFNDSWEVNKLLTNNAQLTMTWTNNKIVDSHGFINTDKLGQILDTRANKNKKHNKQNIQSECFVVDNILTTVECKKLIKLSEQFGYANVGYQNNYRNNFRVVISDEKFTENVYHRIKECVPRVRKKHRWFRLGIVWCDR
eukprot:UN34729